MSENQNSNIYGIIVTILLALAAAVGFFFWQRSQNFKAASEKLNTEIKALETQKSEIEKSLDSLSTSYADLRTENETLQGRVTSTAAQIQAKEVVIKQLKEASSKDVDALKAQIAELQKLKIEYETIISTIKGENEQLRNENQRLTGENTDLKNENTNLSGQMKDLAKQLEEQIRKTQSATFKATSFNVQLERRNDKLTTKARRAREIFVSFDLADVPQPYQGPQKLYLVITNDKGEPITSDKPLKLTINAPAGPVDITAQQVKDVVLESTQRHSFNFKFDDRLKSGSYVVAIYCDRGLLGASSFKLS